MTPVPKRVLDYQNSPDFGPSARMKKIFNQHMQLTPVTHNFEEDFPKLLAKVAPNLDFSALKLIIRGLIIPKNRKSKFHRKLRREKKKRLDS